MHVQQDDEEEALATAATSSSWTVHVVQKYHAHHCVRRQLAIALVEPSLRYHDQLGHLTSLYLGLLTGASENVAAAAAGAAEAPNISANGPEAETDESTLAANIGALNLAIAEYEK